eukprot:TRINITY_DN24857_c0_g1_i1.p1 TRINITY_DN24857_c0_g1~~TRINITY_DN24857_c0_g1_i1.p1  ORF type:complete len:181 (-),score=42.98 TRINITY_DN24857_c0_g1_i1:121-663(-)
MMDKMAQELDKTNQEINHISLLLAEKEKEIQDFKLKNVEKLLVLRNEHDTLTEQIKEEEQVLSTLNIEVQSLSSAISIREEELGISKLTSEVTATTQNISSLKNELQQKEIVICTINSQFERDMSCLFDEIATIKLQRISELQEKATEIDKLKKVVKKYKDRARQHQSSGSQRASFDSVS